MLRRRLAVLVLPVLALLGLAACSTKPVAPPVAVDFSHQSVIGIDVALVDVVDQYRGSGRAPFVDHLAPTPPTVAVRRWVESRLRATGTSGRARVIIRDASIRETELPRTGGVKGMFTNDQAQRYDGRIDVQVEVSAPARGFTGYAGALATHSISVPEDVSLAGRDAALSEMVLRLTQDMGQQLETSMRQNLSALLHY